MRDLGELLWFLGIKFARSGGLIEMDQSKYAHKILSKFNMENCKPRSTPCELGANKLSSEVSEELTDPRLYREIVGSLIYM